MCQSLACQSLARDCIYELGKLIVYQELKILNIVKKDLFSIISRRIKSSWIYSTWRNYTWHLVHVKITRETRVINFEILDELKRRRRSI